MGASYQFNVLVEIKLSANFDSSRFTTNLDIVFFSNEYSRYKKSVESTYDTLSFSIFLEIL